MFYSIQKSLITQLLLILSLFTALSVTAVELETKAACSLDNHSEQYVQIGGIEQWVSIRGKDCNNPVVLVIHGGPGSPWSHVSNEFFEKIEKQFTLVHWDQRGSGKTFGRSKSSTSYDDFLKANTLTIEQMVADGLALSQYLIKRLGKQKIILRAESWGAYLAVNMIKAKPHLFHAYVGNSQLVNAAKNLAFGYGKAIKLARLNNDEQTLAVLKKLGEPPYYHPGKQGRLARIIKQFEKEDSKPSTKPNTIIARYDTKKDQNNRMMGDDYSWTHYNGFKKLGIAGMLDNVDLNKLGFDFKVPIFIFQGAKDLITPPHITKAYFDKINAPAKTYFLIADSGHAPSDKMLDAQYGLLVDKILTLVKGQ
jgi:pimeloyl-ACP methyl ester carboxylesterase